MRPAWLLPSKEIVEALPVRGIKPRVDKERITGKQSRWWHGPAGAMWRIKTLKQRNAYHREYYRKNEKRRAYLIAKTLEYRAKKRKARR